MAECPGFFEIKVSLGGACEFWCQRWKPQTEVSFIDQGPNIM